MSRGRQRNNRLHGIRNKKFLAGNANVFATVVSVHVPQGGSCNQTAFTVKLLTLPSCLGKFLAVRKFFDFDNRLLVWHV